MRTRHVAALVALAALCVIGPPSRQAGADDLNPPLVGMHEMTDAGKTVSITLPKLTEPQKNEGGGPQSLAYWSVKLYEDPGQPHIWVRLGRKSAFSRAPLHGSMTGSYRPGQLVVGSIQSSPHQWQEVRFDAGTRQYFTFRMIEHGGEVFEAMLSCSEKSYPIIQKHIDVILDTFKGVGPPVRLDPPPGHKVSEIAGREVWTDVKMKADVDRVLALQADSWERMKSLLPASFATKGVGRVIICKDDASYAQVGKETLGGAPPVCAFAAPGLRALVVCVSPASKNSLFDRQVQRAAGVQCVEAAFGGALPNWFEQGLSILHLFTTGPRVSVDKPNPVALKEGKASFAKRGETLRDLLDRVTAPAPEDEADVDRLAWMWHWYLREPAQLADDRERYQKYVKTLEESGDVIAARAAWEGADFAAIKTSMAKWLQSR